METGWQPPFGSFTPLQPAFEGFEGAPTTPVLTSAPVASPAAMAVNWELPVPLPSGLAQVMPFDPSFLPGTVAPWIMDISDRMQCPPDFAAVAAIIAMGSVIGRQVGIRPKQFDTWTESANLWEVIVGRPGVMKSPAMNEALKPLKRLEAKANEAFKAEMLAHQREAHMHKLCATALEAKAKKAFGSNPDAKLDFEIHAEPEEPKRKRYMVGDTTYEALGNIVAENPNGVLVYREELVSLLKTLDKEEYVAARGFYLTAWNGNQSYTFDRIGRGHQHIDSVCLSLLGSTQPGRLAGYIGRALKGGEGDDGLIQRFSVMAWPDQADTWRNVDRWPDSAASQRANEVFDWLASPDWDHVQPWVNRSDNSYHVTFDQAAGECFAAWHSSLEHRLRSDTMHVSMESHLAKYRKLVPALALINHMASGGSGSIALASLEMAIRYATYFESHAQRAYGAGLRSDATVATAIVSRIRKGELLDGFTVRDIHQRDWSNLTDREQVRQGLDMLVDHHWLSATDIATGGRPKTIYSINPRGMP